MIKVNFWSSFTLKILGSVCENPTCINLSFANCLRPAQCFISNGYVRVLVSEISDKFSFETFQYGALSFILLRFIFSRTLLSIKCQPMFALLWLSQYFSVYVDLYLSLLLHHLASKVLKSSARYPHIRPEARAYVLTAMLVAVTLQLSITEVTPTSRLP